MTPKSRPIPEAGNRMWPAGVSIRPMHAEDEEEYAGLFCTVFSAAPWHEHWETGRVRRMIRRTRQRPGFIGLVASCQGQAAGYLTGFTAWPSGWWYLDQLFVDEGCRHLGVGRTLWQELELTLSAARCRTVFLLTKPDSPAERFYQRAGFIRWLPWAGFNGKLLMRRRLEGKG